MIKFQKFKLKHLKIIEMDIFQKIKLKKTILYSKLFLIIYFRKNKK